MSIVSYKDLTVWQKSMTLVEEIYKVTKQFPKSEIYGLASQMQRAAVSIPCNIAEGHKRKHILEYIQFLSIANCSSAELETQIELCKRLPGLNKYNYASIENILEEIMKMLAVLINKLTAKRYVLKPNP